MYSRSPSVALLELALIMLREGRGGVCCGVWCGGECGDVRWCVCVLVQVMCGGMWYGGVLGVSGDVVCLKNCRRIMMQSPSTLTGTSSKSEL